MFGHNRIKPRRSDDRRAVTASSEKSSEPPRNHDNDEPRRISDLLHRLRPRLDDRGLRHRVLRNEKILHRPDPTKHNGQETRRTNPRVPKKRKEVRELKLGVKELTDKLHATETRFGRREEFSDAAVFEGFGYPFEE